MKIVARAGLVCLLCINLTRIVAQNDCFFFDFEPREAEFPLYIDHTATLNSSDVDIYIDFNDTVAPVSNYLFGTSATLYTKQYPNYPTLIERMTNLAPSLIRFPGGSLANSYFWDAPLDNPPNDVPDSILDSDGNKIKLWPWYGGNTDSWTLSLDNYYLFRDQTNSPGFISINYGYARYGLSEKPAERAAQYAADWVRYDNGRTKFWEIGNENPGSWEYGWRIDPETNLDGQPEIINGTIYGQHFTIIADSMRKAAAEIDAEIYIGAIILHYDGTDSWNDVDRTWNEEVYSTIGNAADFYVVHNYFGTDAAITARNLLDDGPETVAEMMEFMQGDFINFDAEVLPIALTEWNMGADDYSPPYEMRHTSFISGLQAVLIFGELIRQKYSMTCRWNIANGYDNGNDHGMFNHETNLGIPQWNPRPDYFFQYYIRRFFGDHLVNSYSIDNDDFSVYATKFNSGEMGLVVVNKGNEEQTARILAENFLYGDRYYLYSLTPGIDNGEFSQVVYVNDHGPDNATGGPVNDFPDIPAYSSEISDLIKFDSPPLSAQFLMIEDGSTFIGKIEDPFTRNPEVYPNPSDEGKLTFELLGIPGKIIITDIQGKIVYNKSVTANEDRLSIHLSVVPGIYILTFKFYDQCFTRKLIIQ